MPGTNYSDDKAAYNAAINADITTQVDPNTIPPDVVGSGYTDLADLLEPYINRINNQDLFFDTADPTTLTDFGQDLDLYYQQTNPIGIWRKESGVWLLQGTIPIDFVLPEGNLTVQTNVADFQVTATRGGWVINNTVYQKATQTLMTADAADLNFYRHDIIYADTLNQVLYQVGIASASPVAPILPANTILIDELVVPSSSSGFDPYLLFGGSGINNLSPDDVILNQSGSVQPIASFRISGSGEIGTTLTLAGIQPIGSITDLFLVRNETNGQIRTVTLSEISSGGTGTSADVLQKIRVISWGDSLTEGAQVYSSSYPTQLAKLLGLSTSNKGIGGETSSQILTRFNADPTDWVYSTIIWSGRNNFSNPTQVKADIASMVASLGHNNYLILSILNSDTPSEYIGQPDYNTIIALNNDLGTIYGTHYLDVRSYLLTQGDGSPGDNTDIANGVPPRSLRNTGDPIHLNALGYSKIVDYINANGAGFITPDVNKPLSINSLRTLFNNAPNIGGAQLAKGYFNKLQLGSADPKFSVSNAYESVLTFVTGGIAIPIYQSASGTSLNIGVGVLNIGTGVGGNIISNNGGAGSSRDLTYQSNGSARWILRTNGTVESGSNLGSDFQLLSRTDAGAALGNVLFIKRSSGNIIVNGIIDALFKFDVQGVGRYVGVNSAPSSSGLTIEGSLRISATGVTTTILDSGIDGTLNQAWIQARSATDYTIGRELRLNPIAGNVTIGSSSPVTSNQTALSVVNNGTSVNATAQFAMFQNAPLINNRNINFHLDNITAGGGGQGRFSIKHSNYDGALNSYNAFQIDLNGTNSITNINGLTQLNFRFGNAGSGAGTIAAYVDSIGDFIFNNTSIHFGGVKNKIRTITATTTALVTDWTILCDATSGAITLNLPTAASAFSTSAGQVYNIKKINNTANNITIDPNGAETIDGSAAFTLSTFNQAVTIQSNGTSWFICS